MVSEYFSLHDLLDAKQIIKNSNKLEELLSNGKTLQEVLGISKKLMGEKYHAAEEAFQKKDFEKAKDMYSYLVLLNPHKFICWMRLGACQMHLAFYQKAVTSYSMALVVAPKEPYPAYFAAHCYLKLEDKENACKALSLAAAIAHNDDQHENVKALSLALLEKIKNNQKYASIL